MHRSSPTANSGLRVEQTYPKHKDYLFHLHSLFMSILKEGSQPKIFARNPDK